MILVEKPVHTFPDHAPGSALMVFEWDH